MMTSYNFAVFSSVHFFHPPGSVTLFCTLPTPVGHVPAAQTRTAAPTLVKIDDWMLSIPRCVATVRGRPASGAARTPKAHRRYYSQCDKWSKRLCPCHRIECQWERVGEREWKKVHPSCPNPASGRLEEIGLDRIESGENISCQRPWRKAFRGPLERRFQFFIITSFGLLLLLTSAPHTSRLFGCILVGARVVSWCHYRCHCSRHSWLNRGNTTGGGCQGRMDSAFLFFCCPLPTNLPTTPTNPILSSPLVRVHVPKFCTFQKPKRPYLNWNPAKEPVRTTPRWFVCP